MRAFADLLERLVLTPQRTIKQRLLKDYFTAASDPDRGYALAAIAGTLDIRAVKPKLLRELVLERLDPVLFQYSYDYVGDLAETIALAWTGPTDAEATDPANLAGDLSLGAVIHRLESAGRLGAASLVRDILDSLGPSERFAFLKLVTGGLRVGVSARLVRQALADMGGKDVTEIEGLWHGLEPPYETLFAWLEGKGPKPEASTPLVFRPVMLSTSFAEADPGGYDPADFAAEWKWDGIRVQLVALGGERRLYSRTGEDISAAFPDLVEAADFSGVIDGELLVGGTFASDRPTGTFSDLQQRLNRKSVTKAMLERYPALLRTYDILQAPHGPVTTETYEERRAHLARMIDAADPLRFDLSPNVPFGSWDQLDALRKDPPDPVIEGVMIKRRTSPYVAGRFKGDWFKWKRDPHVIDAVLLYAQRGHGKRSSYYSDFTFGVWSDTEDGPALVPVGKAYFGFTDAELVELDRYVRRNTVDRFGPVRAVRADPDHGFVVEVAFEGLARSTRHKSGVAMRFPRISRLRADKPPREADRLESLIALIDR
ncbi:putative DNA ligase-like protein [Hartmannibacter diazotrophicus]|uniref:DNA ligase (ATP) n=1 Tax=Hartmannibacter diazotrophicus TaxID=1482074 RepID=A0A2C9DCT3_9HYPH|nr:cisplatin damage response ATP-dependent DNA ligase [Hartmannibacter diazotrophicus]SON57938.1 putative DNA ligase-like protein [Hartmannibacter diazotrophicus]